MKKAIICILMAIFCLIFEVSAQQNKTSNNNRTGIQIGQQVPDIAISNIHNYKTKSVKISDFKGKLLIIDFWATWCSPCVAMIPKMDSLQKQFGDKIQFLSVTYQSENEALLFLSKLEKQQNKHYNLPLIFGDKDLHKIFPHSILPHYVWIDQNGIFKATTELTYVTASNINSMLLDGSINARSKNDIRISYDIAKPLLTSNPNENLLKQSSFTGFMEGVGSGFSQNFLVQDENKLKWVTARNLTIDGLFRLAYHKEIKETLFEVDDKSKITSNTKMGDEYRDWLRNGNVFCYELVLDKSLAAKGFEFMRQDLNDFFSNYYVRIQKRKVKCLTLVRTSNVDKIITKGGAPTIKLDKFGANVKSCYLRVFISRMQYFLQSHPLPLADETGYLNMADLDIQANLSNVNEINDALKKYDLKFVEKESTIDMLVIKDKIASQIKSK